jgi:hypothetical protein
MNIMLCEFVNCRIDDIEDNSKMRRGIPGTYNRENSSFTQSRTHTHTHTH